MPNPKPSYWRSTTGLVDQAGDVSADTTTLAESVKSIFMLSMNGGLPLEHRAILNVLGGRLRDQLRELLGQIFDANTAELVEANGKIEQINAQLEEAKGRLDRIAETIENLGKLIASLDKLISIIGVIA